MAISHIEAWIQVAKILQKLDTKRNSLANCTLETTNLQPIITGPHIPSSEIGVGSIRL